MTISLIFDRFDYNALGRSVIEVKKPSEIEGGGSV